MQQLDVAIIGAGFAGLACAKVLAEQGRSVVVLDRKRYAGQGMHTTGILVKEAADLLQAPEALTRKIREVRLYAPNMRYVHLRSSDYFFLTTDTPGLMRHMSEQAEAAGAEIRYGAGYTAAKRENGRIVLEDHGISTACLIGADGPRSKVAEDFSLGQNKEFLLGVEAEFEGARLDPSDAFHCFLDNKLAHGYIGWVIPGVGLTQAGLATRLPQKPDIDVFMKRMASRFGLEENAITGRRGGLIPVGGPVTPLHNGQVALLGDSAGIVSPLTAGGIHTALAYGAEMGKQIAAALPDTEQLATALERVTKSYPSFLHKRAMRAAYEKLAPNWLLNGIIGNPLFKLAAEQVFFREAPFTHTPSAKRA